MFFCGIIYHTIQKRVKMEFSDIKLDRTADEPLHLQLTEALRHYILDSSVNIRHLPSERSLCDTLKLNRSTVHRAYETLLQRGILRQCSNKKLEIIPGAKRIIAGTFPAVGVLLPEQFSTYVSHSYSSSLPYLKGIFDRAAEHKCSVFMLQIPPPESSEKEVTAFMEENLSKLIGIIHLGARDCDNDFPLEKVFQSTHLPQVSISGVSDFRHIGNIRTDFSAAAKELASLLRRKNCRTFGILDCLNLKRGSFSYAVAERSQIMVKHLSDSGLRLLPGWHITSEGPGSVSRTLAAAARSNRDLPDFIWCVNDYTALQTIKFFAAQNIRVPEDLKIAGFDGTVPESGLTTIGQDFYQLGAGAVDLLLEHFEQGISNSNRDRFVKASFISGHTV